MDTSDFMYNPKSYLSKEIILKELAQYSWANTATIDDQDCTVDGIKVRLPKCVIYFSEGFESDMSAYIADSTTEDIKYWPIFELTNLQKNKKDSKEAELIILINDISPFASKKKVINGVKDICTTINSYLLQFIDGDFSLVKTNGG